MGRPAFALLLASLILAGCGGGGGSATPPSVRASSVDSGKLVLTIAQASPAASVRKPQYISPSAVSVSISANGGTPTIADISSTSPNCTTTVAGRVCTVVLTAPVGQDTFAISQYSGANATGTLLGSGTAMANVVAGQPFTIQAVLNGVVATIQLLLGPYPLVGAPGTDALAVAALDSAGNTIVGPGNFTAPIALAVTDPTGQVTLSATTVAGPVGSPVIVHYAGGYGVNATITATISGAAPVTIPFAPEDGIIYTTDFGSNALTAYFVNANGNLAPVRTVQGALTGLNVPRRIAIDSNNNLYVANAGSENITVYPPLASGNTTPIRTISGSNTGLTGADGIILDASNNLYVANCGGCYDSSGTDAVLVFAPGANGNVAPIRSITGSNTQLSGTTNIAFDGAGNLLVTSANGALITGLPNIWVFPVTASGNVAPSGSIGGSNTGIQAPECVAVDSTGAIYVCNNANSTITVYAPGSRGNVTPMRTLDGANTLLSNPDQLLFDSGGNMYVANPGSNSITVYAPGANGNQAPIRTVTGPATQLNVPIGLTLSP